MLGDRQPLCEEPLELAVELELFAVVALVGSKAVVEVCVRPVLGAAEDFFVVSASNRLSAVDAAARIITKLLDMPQSCGPEIPRSVEQAVCQRKNLDNTKASPTLAAPGSRQIMPRRQNLPPCASLSEAAG